MTMEENRENEGKQAWAGGTVTEAFGNLMSQWQPADSDGNWRLFLLVMLTSNSSALYVSSDSLGIMIPFSWLTEADDSGILKCVWQYSVYWRRDRRPREKASIQPSSLNH